jgi:hypothetical protein
LDDVLQKFIDRLTDAYDKNPQSNTYKLMQLTAATIQENEDTLFKMNDWHDVDQAEGKVLDRIGKNVGQLRGQLIDSVYRVLIKAKIKQSLSDGSIDTLIDFLSFVLQVPPTDIEINELWDVGRHATMHINVPGGAINQTGLTFAQFGRLINLVTVAGVKAEALFEGTFSFSSNYNASEFDVATGAANGSGNGGTLGYAYDPANDVELPI